MPVAEQYLGEGNHEAAHAAASQAAQIGEQFGDADLIACARHLQGRARIEAQQLRAGLALLDEAMVAAVAGELTPIMTGLIYCSVIEKCQQVYALSRARQWTEALTSWCEKQPQMNAFRGACLVCRAEILQSGGAWPEAMEEAARAYERLRDSGNQARAAPALYRQAELQRLRGEFAAAEETYRTVSRAGWEPQPGLALLRLAQGRTDAASAALSRVLTTTTSVFARAKLLAAQIEILIASNNPQAAQSACDELEQIAQRCDTEVLYAMSAQARGALEIARGDDHAALAPLRRAFDAWRELDVPYEAARVRVLLGRACRAIGDHDAAELELDAAREVFEKLGATTELARLETIRSVTTPAAGLPVSPRELEVLRLVAAGKTNKEIASALFVSERTIDRHVSNILTKLGVPTRAAAAAHAITHKLLT
ncbi:MAG TPA: LuxR C-terminal-related transcriptional regulator [Kofleriaceae bacterium]